MSFLSITTSFRRENEDQKNLFSLKGRVGKNGETSSSALEFESTQPKKICPFLQTSLQSPSSNTHERAHDQ